MDGGVLMYAYPFAVCGGCETCCRWEGPKFELERRAAFREPGREPIWADGVPCRGYICAPLDKPFGIGGDADAAVLMKL